MKAYLLLLLFLLTIRFASAQKTNDYGVLVKAGEKVLYSFELKANNKIVLVCTEKNNGYIVYRFGTKNMVELQYPAVLNAASWKAFRYNGYSRGGVNNSPTEQHSLKFKNENATYLIDDNWDADENEHSAQINIKINGKNIALAGNASTIQGTLGLLSGMGKLIHNYYWDDNK